MKDKSSETMAATSRMMRVTSCRASHTNLQKVFGGLGGIVFDPNVSRRCSMSFGEPDNPVINNKQMKTNPNILQILQLVHEYVYERRNRKRKEPEKEANKCICRDQEQTDRERKHE
jgi:hypothetical protein